jgi:hypothetical protein
MKKIEGAGSWVGAVVMVDQTDESGLDSCCGWAPLLAESSGSMGVPSHV